MEKIRNEFVTCKMWRDGAPPSPTGAEAGNKTLSLNGAG